MIILICALCVMLGLINLYLLFIKSICYKEMHNKEIKEMTNRELLEQIVHDMSDEELADFICHNDFRNMAMFDNELTGETPKEKIKELLEQKADI